LIVKRHWDIPVIGKYSFVNGILNAWNKLPEVAVGTSNVKKHTFRRRVRKVQTSEGK
jgi:hypothetical protein